MYELTLIASLLAPPRPCRCRVEILMSILEALPTLTLIAGIATMLAPFAILLCGNRFVGALAERAKND